MTRRSLGFIVVSGLLATVVACAPGVKKSDIPGDVLIEPWTPPAPTVSPTPVRHR